MNFLAHMYLSGNDADIITGNFAADFLRSSQIQVLPEPIRRGVYLHRKIDSFTDSHEIFRKSLAILRPSQGKYAPVIADILYDHYLSRFWSEFSKEPLETFSERIYIALLKNTAHFPETIQLLIPRMIDDDFLLSCKNEDRLQKTFERLGKRARFSNAFHRAIDDLNDNYVALESNFRHFFPAISNFVNVPNSY
jgi:acyl carrier protein phosphodiesterase